MTAKRSDKWLKRGLLCALVIIAGFLTFLSHHYCPHLPRRILQTMLHREYVPGPDIRFKWNMAGSGTLSGGWIDFESYQTSDCERVDKTVYRFPTPEAAEAEFQKRLKSGFHVISSTTETDSDGAMTERAVTRVASRGQFFILWRKGDRLLTIDSESLNHALAYEQRLGLRTTVRP